MPRLGHHPVSRSTLERIARLVQIHHITHPERIAKRYGFVESYVNRQFQNLTVPDMERMARELDEWLEGYE